MDVSLSFTAKSPAPPSHQKTSWPELVGMAAMPAVTKIMQDRPNVAVEVHPPGSHLLPGVNAKRVRVIINIHGIVAKIPHVG